MDGRSAPARKRQQAEFARAQWTIKRRKAHAKLYARPSLHSIIDAVPEEGWADFVAFRRAKFSVAEAAANVARVRKMRAAREVKQHSA